MLWEWEWEWELPVGLGHLILQLQPLRGGRKSDSFGIAWLHNISRVQMTSDLFLLSRFFTLSVLLFRFEVGKKREIETSMEKEKSKCS